MIGKLMKYDLKRMLRLLVYFYVAAIGLSVVTRLILIGRDIQFVYIIGQVFLGLAISALASVLINTFAHIIRAFIYNFYKDESYLTHTLPVTKGQLFLSKVLSALIVILTSVVVALVSVFILFYSKTLSQSLMSFIEMTVPGFDMSGGSFIFIMAMVIFSQICAIMSMVFTAIVKGNSYNRKRLGNGIAWFIVYYIGANVITIILVVITFAISVKLANLTASVMSSSAFVMLLVLAIVVYLGVAVTHYFVANKMFKKGVNID